MSDAEFTIRWVPTVGVLAISVAGFWSEGSVANFRRSLEDTTRDLPQAHGESGIDRVLVDARDVQVQQQGVIQALQELLSAKLSRRCRVAVVGGGALQRAQAKRVNSQLMHSSFDNEADAMSWLSEEDPSYRQTTT